MQHAIINAMKCMRAIKDRIARPVYQLANQSVEPLYHARCINRGNHRSVIFRARQLITARWYSDTTNQSVTTPMIALYFSGTTTQSASHNVALNQVINQSVIQAQDNSKGTTQVTEANQLPLATAITAGEHPNLNLLGKLINQFMFNSNLDISYSLEPNSGSTSKQILRNQQLRNLLQGRSTASNGQQLKEQFTTNPAPPKSLKSSAENGGYRWNISHGEQ
ncbi:isoflavone 2'-hydroxylase-like [Dorcoceras hygrometricum]|uniref:Isoflavone 2'-hydroxylase-like n=1 Tax=Dorcoceras hygrometricum TaxID=472368 RepID=A0A2Z7AGR0_9LAMI|nr:isoflavone 2'-hydroxylase-like [Dorcoceras hygrometricum]